MRTRLSMAGLLLTAAVGLTACQATVPGAVTSPVGAPTAVALDPSQPMLEGRVEFSSYRVQATEQDFANQSAVQVLDGNGVVRAAGVTDATGRFVLFPGAGFAPAVGEVFTLEVLRRFDTVQEKRWLTLRTRLKRTSGGWSSYSAGALVVNLATTTLARMADFDAALTPAATMGKISGATAPTLPGHTAQEFSDFKAFLTERCAQGFDPSGEVVYKGDVEVTDAASVEKLAFVNRVEGGLWIERDSSLTTLRLPYLRSVQSFSIENDAFADLSGFPNLTSCDSLGVYDNTALTSLSGLSKLKAIRSLTLSNCHVESLSGLSALEHLENLNLFECWELTSLTGLERVTRLESLSVGTTNNATNNTPALLHLTGLSGLTSVGDLSIQASGLQDLSGLEHLTTVTGNLTIEYNTLLASHQGLSALTSVGGDMTFRSNVVANMAGFGALQHVGGSLSILHSSALTSLTGLESLATIDGSFWCNNNPQLTSVAALTGLTSVGGLEISGNHADLPEHGAPGDYFTQPVTVTP